jgi:RNA polymerase sigma-70 factor (ECF subfamily)
MSLSALTAFATDPREGMLAVRPVAGEEGRVCSLPAPRAISKGESDLDARIELVARAAAAGDRSAFRELTELLMPTLWRLALRLVDDAAAAEDVVQVTVLKLWRALPSVLDLRATRAFACATLRHAAIDEARKAARRRRVMSSSIDHGTKDQLAEPATSKAPDASVLLQSAEAKALVHTALAALSQEHRLVILLCDVDGVSPVDAAVALGVKPGTIASRLSRARTKLSEQVRALAATPPPRRGFFSRWSRP